MKMLTEVSTMLTILASHSGGLPSAGLLYILCALAAVGGWRPPRGGSTMSTERDRATEGVLWPRGRKTVDVRPLAKRRGALVEGLGLPSVSLTCEGFLGQAATTSAGLGMPNLPVAMVPGHVDVQTAEELRRNVLAVTVDAVIEGLTGAPADAADVIEPSPTDVVFEGTPDEVNRVFYERGWSDGLPIVPPTEGRVREC